MGTVDGLFLHALEQFPTRVFLRLAAAPDAPTSYRRASILVARMVRRLERLGLTTGDRVVCYLDDAVSSIYLRLSCAHAGVAAAFMSAASSTESLSQMARRLEAKAIFTLPEHVERVAASGLKPVVLDKGIERKSPMTPEEAFAILGAAASRHTEKDIHHIQATSGSTGQPKLVVRTHESLVRSFRNLAFDLAADDEPPQRVLLVCSFVHGLAQGVFATGLGLAAELCVPRQIDVHASLAEVRALDPTYLVLTPRVLRAFYRQHSETTQRQDDASDELDAEGLFGPSARILVIGGGAADPALLEPIAAKGIDVIDMYATTETGTIAITPRGSWRRRGSTKLVPDVEAKLGEDGELLVRSIGQMLGYYGDPALTRAAFTEDGFYRTGDLAKFGKDGRIQIVGRSRDVFNTNDGSNIYPARIEEMLETIPAVRQAMLVGDQLPYLAAVLVVEPALGTEGRGYLEERAFPGLYAQLARDVAAINATLEFNERVQRFALFDQSFPLDVYRIVGQGKVNRNRPNFVKTYAPWIKLLYAETSAA